MYQVHSGVLLPSSSTKSAESAPRRSSAGAAYRSLLISIR